MAGGQAGSTGGVAAQSPAVNPPNPMGQIGNAVGNAFGGAQQPIPQDTSSMGGNVDFGMNYNPGTLPPGYGPTGFAQLPPLPLGMANMSSADIAKGLGQPQVDPGFGYNPGMQQPGYDPNLAAMFGGPNGQQQLTPDMMAAAQQAMQYQQTGQNPTGQMSGLAALLGGRSTTPIPAVQPAPQPRPAPVASKSTTKTSVVPPKTPPAVANAIRGLAARKPMGRR